MYCFFLQDILIFFNLFILFLYFELFLVNYSQYTFLKLIHIIFENNTIFNVKINILFI